MKPILENIPDELKRLPQWVTWKGVPKESGKLDKLPINPRTGMQASHSNPATWSSYEDAISRMQHDNLHGIGFVFTGNDPYAGVDLDDCIQNGKIQPKAREIIDFINSYSEISPSGAGVKIFVRARLPGSGKNSKSIEIYDQRRFFTLTGNLLADAPPTIEERQQQIETLYRRFFPEEDRQSLMEAQRSDLAPGEDGARGAAAEYPSPSVILSPDGILEKCFLFSFLKEKADSGDSLSHGIRIAIGSYSLALGDLESKDMPFITKMIGGCPDFSREATRKQLESLRGKSKPWGCQKLRQQVVNDFADFDAARCNCKIEPRYGRKPSPIRYAYPERERMEIEEQAPERSFLPPAPHLPLDIFPPKYTTAIREIAAAYSVPVDVPCCALLSIAGACIGRARKIRIKSSWLEHANLWFALVGRSGTGKSPATREIFKHVFALEREWHDRYQEDLAVHQAEIDSRKNASKSERANLGPPPELPAWRQLFVDDATIESVADALEANPRGILWNRDELSGLILDLDKYAGKEGATKSRLIQGYDSGIWKINRVGKKKFIPHATLSLFGSIQPGILPLVFSKGDADSGFLPRFLFVSVERDEPQLWSDECVSEATAYAIFELVSGLLKLDFDDRKDPVLIDVSLEAKALYREWFNEQALEPWLKEGTPAEESILAKLRGQCLRLALILHCVRAVSEAHSELDPVQVNTMEDAIRLANVLKEHQKRAWRFFDQKEEAAELSPLQRRVIEAVLAVEQEVAGGFLPTSRITDCLNRGVKPAFRVTDDTTGRIVAALGLTKCRKSDCRGFRLSPADIERLSSLLNLSVISVTSVIKSEISSGYPSDTSHHEESQVSFDQEGKNGAMTLVTLHDSHVSFDNSGQLLENDTCDSCDAPSTPKAQPSGEELIKSILYDEDLHGEMSFEEEFDV